MAIVSRGVLIHSLYSYGSGILFSPEFQNAFQQTHHNVTTVGDHSLNVAVAALCICAFLAKLHIRTSEKDVTEAALCHDLGIMGRHEKFASNAQCCHQHPIDSMAVAKKLVPDMDDRTLEMIRTHMWPMTLKPPTSREGVIITLADKYCAIREVTSRRPGGYHTEHIRMKRAAAAPSDENFELNH